MQCVHEVDAALEANVKVHAAMSIEYLKETLRRITLFLDEGYYNPETLKEAAGINVSSIKAVCGNPADETMLIRKIKEKEGGFDRLDKVVADFRLSVLPLEVKKKIEIVEACTQLADFKSNGCQQPYVEDSKLNPALVNPEAEVAADGTEAEAATDGAEAEVAIATDGAEAEAAVATDGTDGAEAEVAPDGTEAEVAIATDGAEAEAAVATDGAEAEAAVATDGAKEISNQHLLRQTDSCECCQAAQTIIQNAEVGDVHAIQAVTDQQQHVSAHVRCAVMQVVAKITEMSDARMVDMACTLVEDVDREVQRAAAKALQENVEVGNLYAIKAVAAQQQHSSANVRCTVLKVFAHITEKSDERMVDMACALMTDVEDEDANMDDSVHRAAVKVLQEHVEQGNPYAIKTVIHHSKNGNWRIRQYAIEVLAHIGHGSHEVVHELGSLLEDPIEDVKSAAVDAFGHLAKSGSMIDALFTELSARSKHSVWRVRNAALRALLQISKQNSTCSSPSQVELMCQLFAHPRADARSEAVDTIAKWGKGKPFVAAIVLGWLKHANGDAKLAADQCLWRILMQLEGSDLEASAQYYDFEAPQCLWKILETEDEAVFSEVQTNVKTSNHHLRYSALQDLVNRVKASNSGATTTSAPKGGADAESPNGSPDNKVCCAFSLSVLSFWFSILVFTLVIVMKA